MKHLTIISLIVVASTLMPLRVAGVTWGQLQAERLLELSEVAAVVEISSGEKMRGCGARYHAEVLEPIKGTFKKGSYIDFGPYIGRGVGESFLVFLKSKPKTQAEYEESEPSRIPVVGPPLLVEMERKLERKRARECFRALPPWLEMRGGTATLEVGDPLNFDGKRAVLFQEEWVLPPQGTRKKAWEEFDSEIVSEERSWVSVEDVVAALRRKAASPAP
jgi:hypothetical protein